MNDNHFWLIMWAMVFFTIIMVVSMPTYIYWNARVEFAKQGYVEKIIVVRPGGDFIAPIYEHVWIKEGIQPSLGTPSISIEKK